MNGLEHDGVAKCLTAAIDANPLMKGIVLARWSVAHGNVTSVSNEENTTGSIDLQKCLEGAIPALTFPSGITVTVGESWLFGPP